MVCITDSQRKLLCEQTDVNEQFRRTLFEIEHLKNQNFDQYLCHEVEINLPGEMLVSSRGHTLHMWQDNFSVTEVETALKDAKGGSFGENLINSKTVQNWRPNTKLAVFNLSLSVTFMMVREKNK